MRRPFLMASLVVLLSACFSTSGAADPAADFQEGLRRFNEAAKFQREHPSQREQISRRFRSAAESFVASWMGGANTTEVFTNAANSYYFAGDIGEAVLFYRRALAAAPGNTAARGGLEHIRETLPIRRRAAGAGSLTESLFFWHDERFFLFRVRSFYLLFPAAWILFAVELSRRRWRWVHGLLVLVFPLALLGMLLSYLFRLRRPYATVGALCLIPALACLGSLAVEAVDNRSAREAVVQVEVRGRNGNGESYSPSHTRPFPPGTEVEVTDRRSDGESIWLNVKLLDGSDSFLPEDTVEYVVPRVGGQAR